MSHLLRFLTHSKKMTRKQNCRSVADVVFFDMFSFSDLALLCMFVLPFYVSVCMCVHLCNQEYITELQALLCSVSETDFKLNSPEYWPAAYYNMSQQEHCLKVSIAFELLSESPVSQN